MLTQAALICDAMYKCEGKVAYAVSVGAVSLIICLGIMFYAKIQGQPEAGVWKVIAIVLAVWWIVALCYLSFELFIITGNAYF